MPRTQTRYIARCITCPWTADTGDVDLAARKHTGERGVKSDGTNHPTVVEGVPA